MIQINRHSSGINTVVITSDVYVMHVYFRSEIVELEVFNKIVIKPTEFYLFGVCIEIGSFNCLMIIVVETLALLHEMYTKWIL